MHIKEISITQPFEGSEDPEIISAVISVDAEFEATCESCGIDGRNFVTAHVHEDTTVNECLGCFLASDWDKIELAK